MYRQNSGFPLYSFKDKLKNIINLYLYSCNPVKQILNFQFPNFRIIRILDISNLTSIQETCKLKKKPASKRLPVWCWLFRLCQNNSTKGGLSYDFQMFTLYFIPLKTEFHQKHQKVRCIYAKQIKSIYQHPSFQIQYFY